MSLNWRECSQPEKKGYADKHVFDDKPGVRSMLYLPKPIG